MILSRGTMQELLKRSGNKCEVCGVANDIGPGGVSSGERLYVVERYLDPSPPALSEADFHVVLCRTCKGMGYLGKSRGTATDQLELFTA